MKLQDFFCYSVGKTLFHRLLGFDPIEDDGSIVCQEIAKNLHVIGHDSNMLCMTCELLPAINQIVMAILHLEYHHENVLRHNLQCMYSISLPAKASLAVISYFSHKSHERGKGNKKQITTLIIPNFAESPC